MADSALPDPIHAVVEEYQKFLGILRNDNFKSDAVVENKVLTISTIMRRKDQAVVRDVLPHAECTASDGGRLVFSVDVASPEKAVRELKSSRAAYGLLRLNTEVERLVAMAAHKTISPENIGGKLSDVIHAIGPDSPEEWSRQIPRSIQHQAIRWGNPVSYRTLDATGKAIAVRAFNAGLTPEAVKDVFTRVAEQIKTPEGLDAIRTSEEKVPRSR